uniref:Uncharacterized protein n=1 Tax=Tanacetum cinerariifolium TaxID=118510 RepID=A0A699KQU9_TANCI|nr:hypothetical protein [Tanacetum cinerariifolium]
MITDESCSQFVTQKRRRSGVQKRYGKGRATGRRTEDIGSSNPSSRGVSSLYMDIILIVERFYMLNTIVSVKESDLNGYPPSNFE